MAYEKKLCILKQIGKGFTADGMPLMGAVYAERLGSELTLTPRIAGLAPLREGRYALAAVVGKKEYCFELKGNTSLRAPDCPSLENGFAVLLCFVKEETEPVAFGSCGSAPGDYHQLVGIFRSRPGGSAEPGLRREEAEQGQPVPPMPLPPTGIPGVPGPNTPFAPGVPLPGDPSEEPPEDVPPGMSGETPPCDGYDDEALAGGGSLSEGQVRYPPLPRSAPFGVDAVGGRAPRHRLSFGRSPLCMPCGGGAGRKAPRNGGARGVRSILTLFGRRGLLRRFSGRRHRRIRKII